MERDELLFNTLVRIFSKVMVFDLTIEAGSLFCKLSLI